MTKTMIVLTATLAAVLTTDLALARHHVRNYGLPYPLSYNHNYGPSALPGAFAYYDGSTSDRCAQSAATYLGQDNRRHPCN